MESLIKKMLSDIAEYENNNLANNVKNRLDDSLRVYLSEISNSYYRVHDNVNRKAIKELTK